MKALEIVLSSRLGAKKVCQAKWKLFQESLDMDVREAPPPEVTTGLSHGGSIAG